MLQEILLFTILLFPQVNGRTVAQEESLRSALLTGYSADVRPNDTVTVQLGIGLLALNELNIGTQTMSMSLMLMLHWHDYRLQWNSASYGGISMLRMKTSQLWKPIVIIENEIEHSGAVGLGDDYGITMRLKEDGMIEWPPSIVTTTSCDAKITYFPYDVQECRITVTGWGDSDSEVSFTTGGNILTYMAENGEWELLRTRTDVGYFEPGSGMYTRTHFYFTFRRRWQFYGQNLIMPLILTSILMCASFLLPIESGEKMGYCLTVLLSYVVFLTWITDNLPPISSDTSVLQIYLAIVLCLGVAATLLTTWVVHLYHRDPDQPMSSPMRAFVDKLLYPVWTFSCSSCKKPRLVQVQEFAKGGEEREQVTTRGKGTESMTENFFGRKPDGKQFLRPRASVEEEEGKQHSWQEVAVMLDWFCFLTFCSLKMMAMVVILLLLYSAYF